MKSFVTTLFVLLFLSLSTVTSHAQSYRRGNPGAVGDAKIQFFILDSDDNDPLKPTYSWIDTTTGFWQRLHFANDDAEDSVTSSTDSVNFAYYTESPLLLARITLIPPPPPPPAPPAPPIQGCTISANGTICLNGVYNTPRNVVMTGLLEDVVAPLWTDWEFRTTGDSSKVFGHVSNDTAVVSYYNMGLKGTNGKIRATFQVVFKAGDTTITFNYKEFGGSLNGVPAAKIIQNRATIGVAQKDASGAMNATYLHKGYYYARSTSSSLYALDLHDNLSVRFLRRRNDAFQIQSLNIPYDHYELSTNTIVPSAQIRNLTDTAIKIFIRTRIQNVQTGSTFYNTFDSLVVNGFGTVTYTGQPYNSLNCGFYRLTVTLSYRNDVSDQWSLNNSLSHTFSVLSSQSVPFRDEFTSGPSVCAWNNAGVVLDNAYNLMYAPDAGYNAGSPSALVLNRLDENGMPYPKDAAGDTLTSAPMDLTGKSNVYVYFHYQRGLVTDSVKAGVLARTLSGPEGAVHDTTTLAALQPGDTLYVEGLTSSGSTWNPSASSWTTIGIISGGLDVSTQTFRALLPSALLHNHFRLRLRVVARDQSFSQYNGLPMSLDDADNFVVDAIHVEPFQITKTDLETIDVDLGNGIYTHVPRDLTGGLRPKVRVMNNGDGVALGLSLVHLIVRDALNRPVYDKIVPFSFPSPRKDSVINMPAWDIHGTQGGTLTARVILEQLYYDSYKANDTNVFIKKLAIDDTYGLDDGTADTVGSVTKGLNDYTLTFVPLGNDTVRGVDAYFTGTASASSWTLSIADSLTTVNRGMSYSPLTAQWYRSTFTPVPLVAGRTYTLHFVSSTSPTLGGDASRSLIYNASSVVGQNVTTVPTALYPELITSYYPSTIPSAIVQQGGPLLPMMRLVTSGSLNYLPVDLASFQAERTSEGSVLLRWRTAEEENAYTFEVERVEENSNVSVGQRAARNLTSGGEYQLTDAAAPAGALTYDLIERDLDGSRRAIGRVEVAALASDPLTIQAYPNPAHNRITLILPNGSSSLKLVDPLGRTIRELPADPKLELDLTTVAPGVYWIEARTEGTLIRRQISVTR